MSRVRNLLRGVDLVRPRRDAWWELGRLLQSGEPIEDEDAIVLELARALAHWPDALRYTPFDTAEEGASSQSSRIMRKLARTTSLDHRFLEAAASDAFFHTSPTIVHLALHEVHFEEAHDWPAFVRAAGSQLRTLSLSGCGLTDDDLLAIAHTPLAHALHGLSLVENEVTDHGLVELLGALPNLQQLELVERALGEPFAKSMSASAVSERLTAVTLVDCELDEAAIDAMQKGWPALRKLSFAQRETPGASRSFSKLAASPLVRGLTDLDVAGLKLDPHESILLAEIPFERLDHLTLRGNHVVVDAIRSAPWLAGLSALRVVGADKVNPQRIAALRASLEDGVWVDSAVPT